MSADLLAAFGDQVSTEDAKKTVSFPENALSRSDQLIGEDRTQQPWPTPQRLMVTKQDEGGLWRSQAGGSDVLFDADEDEFGDFEEAEQAPQTFTSISRAAITSETSVDLLGLEDTVQSAYKRPAQSSTISQKSPLSQPQKVEQLRQDDDWGAFEDVQSSHPDVDSTILEDQIIPTAKEISERPISAGARIPNSHQTKSTGPILQPDTTSDGFDEWDEWNDNEGSEQITELSSSMATKKQAPILQKEERPTNIPPPAVLLSLVPKVLVLLSSKVGSTTETGPQVIEVYKVCARLIAGRGLRRKRDTILAQSMRIGVAGRSGGMKLTVLDKGESRKENQEVEEALSTWSRLSLKLNAAISKAKLQKPPLSLSTNIVVRTATGSDVLNATHPCPICGLKRNERINGIDVNIYDLFGEFWVEYWGHKDCHDFWYRFNSLLDQRQQSD